MSKQTAVASAGPQTWTSADAVQSGVDIGGRSGTDDARGLGQELRVGQRVVTSDGQRGLVLRLLRDSHSHLVTRFVVLTRPLFGRELVVPVEAVVEVTRNHLSMEIDASELDRLPAYRTDEEIDRDVERALSNDEELRRSGQVLARAALG